jgi:hypothetical protein
VECDINVNNEHSNVSFLERKGTYVDFWCRRENIETSPLKPVSLSKFKENF